MLRTWLQLPRALGTTAAAAAAPLLLRGGRPLHSSITCCQPPAAPSKAPAIPPVKRITRDDVQISFARSSGAGGQNVNKVTPEQALQQQDVGEDWWFVNTKVDMRLRLDAAAWLDEEIREALRQKEKKRINKEGELVLTSQRTRSQADNVEDALEKLQEMLDDAWKAVQPIEEDPEKAKEIQKQLERGNKRRLQDKKFAADKKKERRAKIDW